MSCDCREQKNQTPSGALEHEVFHCSHKGQAESQSWIDWDSELLRSAEAQPEFPG